MENLPGPRIHPPMLLSVLAVTAVVLATLQWLQQLLAERQRAAPSRISREFAARFALPAAEPIAVRAQTRQRSR